MAGGKHQVKKNQKNEIAEVYQVWYEQGEDRMLTGMLVTLDILGYNIIQRPGGSFVVVEQR